MIEPAPPPRNAFLIGEKVYLRAIEEADAATCYEWFSDRDIAVHLARSWIPNTEKGSLEFIRGVDGKTHQMFAIMARAEALHVGNIDLFRIHPVYRHAELGVAIGRKDHWGRGLGREAVRLLCRHAFRGLNLHKVYLRVHATNERAIRCYTAAGFKPEGRSRDDVFIDGRYVDTIIMGLLRGELDAGPDRPDPEKK